MTPFLSFLLLATIAPPGLLTIPSQFLSPSSDYSTTTIEAYVRHVQREHHLRQDFYDTLEYESQGWQNEQSEILNPKGPNRREDSWGVCQIYLPAHPEITKEQAMNPEWCIEWTAKEFLAGRSSKWTAWRLLHAKQSD